MPQSERFDVLVLGSGTGGKLIAWHMARLGQRTAVVERQWIGGGMSEHRLYAKQE
jgi:pyruvate/2-oxoglutarate dehydrogenase complex dihydrolipoamide dehydrogenase (E3) component